MLGTCYMSLRLAYGTNLSLPPEIEGPFASLLFSNSKTPQNAKYVTRAEKHAIYPPPFFYLFGTRSQVVKGEHDVRMFLDPETYYAIFCVICAQMVELVETRH